jgi:hypothetical protein
MKQFLAVLKDQNDFTFSFFNDRITFYTSFYLVNGQLTKGESLERTKGYSNRSNVGQSTRKHFSTTTKQLSNLQMATKR